ncbi:MAG: hypothetical protein AB1716_14735, partial [Planctomycetota bacterium]
MVRKVAVLVVIGLSSVAWGQDRPPLQHVPTPGQVAPTGPVGLRPPQDQALQGEQKLRWVVKQLRLEPQQQQQAEALIEIYQAEVKQQQENPTALLSQIQDLYAQVRAAQSANDTAKVEELRAQLRDLTPGRKAEKNFFEGLEQMLKPEQKERLAVVRKRAESGNIDITFRPVHVLRAAMKVGLTAEQYPKLETILDEYRTGLLSNRPADAAESEARVEKLVTDMRGLLTPEQAENFDKQVAELRETVPAPTPVELPTTNPATP